MKNLISRFTNNEFTSDESGATAIEYGLIAAAMAVVLIAGFVVLSPAIGTMFTNIAAALAV